MSFWFFGVLVFWGGGDASTYAQFLPLHVVRLSPEQTTRRRHRFVSSAPVQHVRVTGYGHRVDDGHGVGGEELVPAVVGCPERRGQVAGLVEPEDAEEDLGGGFVPADFENQGGPEGGVGEVVAGDGDGVVGLVFFLVALDFEGDAWGSLSVGLGFGFGIWGENICERSLVYVLTSLLKRSRLSQMAVGRTM